MGGVGGGCNEVVLSTITMMQFLIGHCWENMIIFIQNDKDVPPGEYAERLAGTKLAFRVVRPFMGEEFPPLDETSAVIVLGGSMGVNDTGKHPFLVRVKDYIRTVLVAEKPYLGICLGGQLLAEVAGAKVSSNLHGEIGMATVSLGAKGLEDALFRFVPGEFKTFQWHNDSFALPGGAIHLAGSGVCSNQAFRYGEKAYGLQFHPEVNARIVGAWCRDFDTGSLSREQILAGFITAEYPYRETSLRILHNFLDIARIRY
jgi:GMP synthase (glutamine-hydrolysing)